MRSSLTLWLTFAVFREAAYFKYPKQLYLQSLHKGFSAGFGYCAEVVDEIGFGHAAAGVQNGDRLVHLIRGDLDVQLFAGVQLTRIGKRLIADFVQRLNITVPG